MAPVVFALTKRLSSSTAISGWRNDRMGLRSPRCMARRIVLGATPKIWAASAILYASRSGLLVCVGTVGGVMCGTVELEERVHCGFLFLPGSKVLPEYTPFFLEMRICGLDGRVVQGKIYKVRKKS